MTPPFDPTGGNYEILLAGHDLAALAVDRPLSWADKDGVEACVILQPGSSVLLQILPPEHWRRAEVDPTVILTEARWREVTDAVASITRA